MTNRIALSPSQTQLLRDSLDMLAPHGEELARVFYARLFYLDPSLRLLFRRDMTMQHHKWVAALNDIFSRAHDQQQIAAAARHLGRRHRQVGVQDEDYRLVGEALLWSLREVLAEAFTPALHDAWSVAYAYLAQLMQQAAHDVNQQSGL